MSRIDLRVLHAVWRLRVAAAAASHVEGSERSGDVAGRPVATAENPENPKSKYPATDFDIRHRVDDAK
jgi:hypothetical protein